jgi:hypothetical protein
MRVPFTQQQFLDVFGAYNSTTWPVVIAFWLVTLAFGVRFVRGRPGSVALSALAAVHWAWSGLVYHALFFTDINPAAWWFAGMFLLEAFAFVWFGMVRRTLAFEWGHTVRHAVAARYSRTHSRIHFWCWRRATMCHGRHSSPSRVQRRSLRRRCCSPLFAPAPVLVFVIPVMWATLAGTAAIALGVTPDLMLFVAAICLIVYVARPSSFAFGTRLRS